jgi:lysophospholipase L1-like esterase
MAPQSISPKKTRWPAFLAPGQGRAAVGLLFAGLLALQGCATRHDDAPAGWVASWGTAQLAVNPPTPTAELAQPWQEPFDDVSLRQVVRLSMGGSALRVQLSNALGRTPLVISAAVVSLAATASVADQQPQPLPGTLRTLLFAGQRGVTLAPGTEAWSDAVPLATPARAELLLDLHIVKGTAPSTAHPGSRMQSWAFDGNRLARADTGFWPPAAPRVGWWHVAAVDVQTAQPQAVLVAIGDSITDGYGVTNASYQRWTDIYLQRLATEGRNVAVVNTGIGGNRLLRDGLGPHVLQRFERDALNRSGVTHAVLLVGVNDLGVQHRENQDAPEARAELLRAMKAGFSSLAARAHARGVCLIAATVLPYAGSGYYKPGDANEADRVALNQWLRTSKDFDGVADFDAALLDPARPALLLKALDSGDGLHPSPTGYAAMAAAFPTALLDRSCRRAAP